MNWELDHVFLACSDVEGAKRAISDFGIVLNEGRIHRGQGTANVCANFDNAYFELLYSVDGDELGSEVVRPLGLKERIEWQTTGACPFGVCFRPTADAVQPPVRCWPYAPAYVPVGSSIPIVTPRGSTHEPLVFISTHRYIIAQGVTIAHRGEKRTLTRVCIQHPGKWRPSAGVRWFAENGPLSLNPGAKFHLELIWGDGGTGRSEIGNLPLCFSW